MTWKKWKSSSRIITVGILAGLVGLITPGFASSATLSTEQLTQDKNITKTDISSQNTLSRGIEINQVNSTNVSESVSAQQIPEYADKTQQLSSYQADDNKKLPFIGTRFFNFLGGTGTGQSITIEANGDTTIKLHGTVIATLNRL